MKNKILEKQVKNQRPFLQCVDRDNTAMKVFAI